MSRFRDFESRTEPPTSRLFRRAESEMRRHQSEDGPDARAVRAASSGQWWGRRTRGAGATETPADAGHHRPVSAPAGPSQGPAAGNALSEALSRLGSETGAVASPEARPTSRRRQRVWEVEATRPDADAPSPPDAPPPSDVRPVTDAPLSSDALPPVGRPWADRGQNRGGAPSRPAAVIDDEPPARPDADEIAYARAQMARMSERGLVAGPDPDETPRRAEAPRHAAEPEDDRAWEEAARRAPRHDAPKIDAAGPASGADHDEVARARAQIARMGGAAGLHAVAAGGAGDSGRARTRVLGFGGAVAPADPFGQDAADALSRGGAFPVGWLVIVDGPGRGASFALTGGVAHVGRGADQTVCLDFGDDAISRTAHASIAFDPEDARHYLGAGAKSNLVRRNGRPVLGTEELASGDMIRVGETTLRFVAFCDESFVWEGTGDAGERNG